MEGVGREVGESGGDGMMEEADILALMKAGHYTPAFELLLGRMEVKMRHLARSYLRDEVLAEDVAQEIFVKIWRGMSGFSGRSSVSTWAYAIGRNTCLTEIRKQAIRRQVSLEDPEMEGAMDRLTELQMTDPEVGLEDEVRGCLEELPDRYRQVLVLFYLEQHSYEEVAGMLGIPMGTVKTHLFRAKREFLSLCEKRSQPVRSCPEAMEVRVRK